MNVITDAVSLASLFSSLTSSARDLYWAVAWATSHSEIFPVLKANRRKIRRLIVGTHFYQTDPVFMREFHAEATARFILQPAGVFHPKVFLFIKPDKTWDCIVGSANLSALAFTENSECVVHFSDKDLAADFCKDRVLASIESYWNQAKTLNAKEIDKYEKRWKIKNDQLRRVSERFKDHGASQKGKATLEIPILTLAWKDFVAQVNKEKTRGGGLAREHRLCVLENIHALFKRHGKFNKMSYEDRQKVAGLTGNSGLDYKWFGSMLGAGHFKHAVKINSPHVSRALDLIPLTGKVDKQSYLKFIEELQRAFPSGGVKVGIATRLLAMKRPDVFVCLDSKNRRKLALNFSIPQSVTFEDYWESIIERIRDSSWWHEPCPASREERRIWTGRAAMLDSICYERS